MPEEIDQLQSLIESLTAKLIDNAPQIIAAAVILVLGLLVGSSISKLILGICTKKKIDVTLSRFFSSSIKLIIVLLFLFVAVNRIGINITPFIALLGAGALGLSIAIQGPISNYASGIAIILTRPFKVHDTLTIHGITGIVSLISLGYTRLETEDGQEITIPNKKILGEILTNSFSNLLVEGVVGIDYGGDPEHAIACINTAISNTEGIDAGKAPQVGIEAFGDSSINIGYRYWVKTNDYYAIQYKVNLEVFKALKQAQISIPFPQRDIHIVSNPNQNFPSKAS